MTDIPFGRAGILINLEDQPGSCGVTCPCDRDATMSDYGYHWSPGDPVYPPWQAASRQLLGAAHSLLCGTSPVRRKDRDGDTYRVGHVRAAGRAAAVPARPARSRSVRS